MLLLALLGTLSLVAAKASYPLSGQVFAASQMPFTPHVSNHPLASYLEMVVPAAPVHALARLIDPALTVRPETHITVVTPPEYDNVLAPYISMATINEIATRMNIQQSTFETVCIGRVQKKLPRPAGQPEPEDNDVVYFILVSSKDLLEIRHAIFEEYVANGGEPGLFDPNTFYSHITVGYSYRDMFVEDGVFKSENSCWADISKSSRRRSS